jgi:hypothetical protein
MQDNSSTINIEGHNSAGPLSFTVSSNSTTSFIDNYGPRSLERIEHHPEQNQMHIIYRRKPNFTYTVSTVTLSDGGQMFCNPQPNDKLEKEIWSVSEDGKLELFTTIEGEVIPPSYTAEQFKFDDPEGATNTDPSGSDS